jgi:hypothetical protein
MRLLYAGPLGKGAPLERDANPNASCSFSPGRLLSCTRLARGSEPKLALRSLLASPFSPRRRRGGSQLKRKLMSTLRELGGVRSLEELQRVFLPDQLVAVGVLLCCTLSPPSRLRLLFAMKRGRRWPQLR